MRFCTTWMSFSLAVALASAVLIALTVTPAVSLAGTASGRDASQTAVGAAATLDARLAGGAMEPAPVGLQMMESHDDFWDSGWWIVMVVMMVLFWGGVCCRDRSSRCSRRWAGSPSTPLRISSR